MKHTVHAICKTGNVFMEAEDSDKRRFIKSVH